MSIACRTGSRLLLSIACGLLSGCVCLAPSTDYEYSRNPRGCEWQSPLHRPCYELRHHTSDCCTCRQDIVNQIDDIISP